MPIPIVFTGTRPEIIKMAPIIAAFKKIGQGFLFVHSGQHYDYEMSIQFMRELELPEPDFTIKLRAGDPVGRLGILIRKFGEILRRERPSIVLVEGDTDSVLAGALAANKLGIPIGHVEAGLRSYDLRMPEEHNRRLVDHISNYLFAPTQRSKLNLDAESVWGKVYVTGNTIIDSCINNASRAERLSKISAPSGDFALATIHRAENVDDPRVLGEFIQAFIESPIRIVLPLHPRTRARMRRFNLWKRAVDSENLTILPPLGYFDFLALMRRCRIIVTDSGGIQEEATAPVIRKRVVVLRYRTERPEAVEAGFARVAGLDKESILESMRWALEERRPLPEESPFGDGRAAERIVDILGEVGAIGV